MDENKNTCNEGYEVVSKTDDQENISPNSSLEAIGDPVNTGPPYSPYGEKIIVEQAEYGAARLRGDETRPEDLEKITEWPEIANDAYYGLAGDIVRAIEPHTEADPVALLTYLLAGFGNLIGRGPHFVAEADQHFANIFAVLVGETAKGRKDSARGQILRLLRDVDPSWEGRITHGLSSGEGLIHAVRDGISDEDPGVEDKRLFVVESEFASPLKVMRREGNTLSVVVRNAWDRGDLRVMTRRDPLRATGAHVTIIGHATKDEILRHLTETEVGNGFGNRFLWVCVRRSKCLPEGGRVSEVDFAPLLRRLCEAARFARGVGEVRRDEKARKIWCGVYPELSEGKPGLLGAMIARSEAQTMRLALIYALLDCSSVIRGEHLLAGLSVWNYAEASARYIFGASLGDPLADELLAILRSAPEGLTMTTLHDYFKRNQRAASLHRALRSLMSMGLVDVVREDTDGRPREIIRLRKKRI